MRPHRNIPDSLKTARGIINGGLICLAFWSFFGLGFSIWSDAEDARALRHQEAFSSFRSAGVGR